MRRLALAGLLCGALNAVGAESVQTIPAPPLVSIERQGYAFEYPRVLAEQRLFGIAHGVAMLAESCRGVEATAQATAQATADAYVRWYDQQRLQIEDLKNNLAAFYYGLRASEASWQHLVAALNLREKITLAPGSEQLTAACATLPEALQQPRYDLSALFQLEAAIAAMSLATRVDAQLAACSASMSGKEQAALLAAQSDWQRREGAAVEAARGQLLYYWRSTATTGEPEEWLKAQARRYANPPAGRCAELAVWLKSDAASLGQSFAPAPLPPLAPEEAPDHAVSAVVHSTPQNATVSESSAAPASETAPESATAAGLFDSLMKVFDERPYESRPPRSQRAHP